MWPSMTMRAIYIRSTLEWQTMAKPSIDSDERVSDQDALRLVLAFFCILEPEKRSEVMALAQRYASEASALSADSLSCSKPRQGGN